MNGAGCSKCKKNSNNESGYTSINGEYNEEYNEKYRGSISPRNKFNKRTNEQQPTLSTLPNKLVSANVSFSNLDRNNVF